MTFPPTLPLTVGLVNTTRLDSAHTPDMIVAQHHDPRPWQQSWGRLK
jgi:hypothetical protein